jgi:hypothetical protein
MALGCALLCMTVAPKLNSELSEGHHTSWMIHESGASGPIFSDIAPDKYD